jgi:hypothetical protein
MQRPAPQTSIIQTILFSLMLLSWVTGLAGDDQALPSPLSLGQALALAEDHPRLSSPDLGMRYPRPEPLFLGCHGLAFPAMRAGDARRDQAWSLLVSPLAAQRLEIMQRFFDVLLAELRYAEDNEAMAVAYVQLDRASVRAELGQVSPIRVAELEVAYQRIRLRRTASAAAQRMTRALLAQAMGSSGTLPRDLRDPKLPPSPTAGADTLADPGPMVDRALAENRWLRQRIADADEDERDLLQMALRTEVLELSTRLGLLAVAADEALSVANWRDLALDESRTLYEMEAAADLGYSMSRQTEARRREAEVRYCQVLTRAQLDALQGQPVNPSD